MPKVIAAIGCAILLVALASGLAGAADNGPSGLTEPQQLPPFNPNAANCAPPTSLERVLAFAQDNKRDFMEGVRHGLEKAAADRGLRFDSRLANNDANLMIQQVEGLVADKAGGVVAAPVDPASLAPSIQKLIWRGSYVGMVVPPPATTILNAPQYLTGKVLGDAAASYIKEELNGKADVVLLTHDTLQFLAPRFTAMRDALKDMPGREHRRRHLAHHRR